MKLKKSKIEQNQRLEEICNQHEVGFGSITKLLDFSKSKKLRKRNNYHQQTINEEIEKAIK